jgi:predicted CXXCH cytochrome family protein
MTVRDVPSRAIAARLLTVPVLVLVTSLGSLATASNWPSADADVSRALRHGPGNVNHPVGVRPSHAVHVPKGWPLGTDGCLTCTTCHESIPALSGHGGAKLRRKGGATGDPSAFCATCHGTTTSGAAGMHWRAMQRAHVRSASPSRTQRYGALDADSIRCLSCHDGVTARETAYETASGHGVMALGDTARDHPVGVRYRAYGRERGSKLRAEGALPATVRLPGGRVSCVSCHDLYSREPKLLTVPIEGSALCFTCHDMD